MFNSLEEYIKACKKRNSKEIEFYASIAFDEMHEIINFLKKNEIFFEDLSTVERNIIDRKLEFTPRIKTYNQNSEVILMYQSEKTNGLMIKYPGAEEFESITIENAIKYFQSN